MVSEFVVITGLSGAGRSEAGDHLEDLGWFVIDNLPPALMTTVAELGAPPGSSVGRVALIVGVGPYHDEVLPAIKDLKGKVDRVRIVYLEASTDTLVRRYESTRHRHPLAAAGDSLRDAIEAERVLLEGVRAEADVVVDTSELHVHQLRDRIVDLFAGEGAEDLMQMTVLSFGYKHGLPVDVDVVLDCRFLPNPHWVDELREQTGEDPEVQEFVLRHGEAQAFLSHLRDLFTLLAPAYAAEGKAYLTVALGCTGGRHRSVVMAREVAAILTDLGYQPSVSHRDLKR